MLLWALLLCAVGAAAVLGCLLWLRGREMRAIAQELRRIRTERLNSLAAMSLPTPAASELVGEINQMLQSGREAVAEYRRADLDLRRAIENISHDLRTPLTSILGYVQLVQAQDTPEEDKQRYLEIVEQRCRVLQRLITRFYDLSRLQAGEYQLELTQVDLSALLRELTVAFYNDFTAKGLEPSLDIGPRLEVRADRDAATRIFTNLLQNALRYAHSRISIRLYRSGNEIVTEFENDAPELTQEDAERLFERFFTAGRVRSGLNTGLGLAITQALAEQMGSRVSARLEENFLLIRVCWQA